MRSALPILTSIKGYQRHRPAIDNALVAGFLALVAWQGMAASGVYGGQWIWVLVVGIVAVGIQNRAWGYYAAVAALVAPVWSVSPYLMALFLAVALLPRNFVIAHLPYVLLAVSAPLLSEWHVLALAPLVAGLAGGATAGLGVGLACALWLKIVAGLADVPAELGFLHGFHIAWATIDAHVKDASSLEILQILVAPFFVSSTLLLLHALQIVGWGIGGWLVGKVRYRSWVKGEPRFLFVPAIATGALVMWASLFLVPAWLGESSITAFLAEPRIAAGLALAGITTAFLTALWENAQRPVARQITQVPVVRRRGREGMIRTAAHGVLPATTVTATNTRLETGRWQPRPLPSQDDDEGVIMLEID